MNIIQSKSPCIVEVTDANLEGGTIYLYIYKNDSPFPSNYQYKLSKLTPASNVDSVFFDVAPYAKEFINNKVYTPNVSTNNVNLPIDDYCLLYFDKYKLVGGVYVYVSNLTFSVFNGYLEQKNALNPITNTFLLDQKTYYYYYNSANPTAIPFGDVTLYNVYNIGEQYTYKYTNLVTGLNHSYSVSVEENWKKIFRVYPSYASQGNKLEIISDQTGVVATYYFRPIEECRYTPVTLDFINKYGAWQREFLFKNSTDSINVESQSYKNYRAIPNVLNSQESLVTSFNTNGIESIKTNTGWVNEDFKGNLKQVLLSDRILINNRPATITTKQVELQKNINNKLINYSLDFQFSNSII